MTRVVVTGGAGFLGSHLCERLLADGCDVLALDNFLTGTPANVEHLLENDRFRLVKADITDYVHVSGPVDQVLHFASPASPIDYLLLPIETLKVGSIGTLHALGLAKEKGARFLLASTSETYGDPQVHPQPETYWGHVNPVGPRGVYDEAKRYAEALTMAYRRTHQVDTGILRIFNSVLADEQLVYDDGSCLQRTTAAELAERLGLSSAGAVPLTGWHVPSFDSGSQINASEASWFVAHPTDQVCFAVRTRYGRDIKVTGDHSLFVRGEDGRPVARAVNSLSVGEDVAVAARVDVVERDRPVVDMLDVLRDHDPWTVAVSFEGAAALIHEHRAELVTAYLAHRASAARQSAWGTLHRWRKSGWVPLGAMQACGLTLPLEAHVRQATGGSKTSLPRLVVLSDELLWVLGLWVAEGCWSEAPPKTYAIGFSCDSDVLDTVQKIVERDLGQHCVRTPASPARAAGLWINGRLLLDLLRHLGFGKNKSLPGWMLALPLRRLSYVIDGYREGDGVHSGKKFEAAVGHEFSTTSEALKDDLVFAFARFGLVPSVGRYSSTFKQRYGDRRFPFWRLTLCNVSPWSPLDWPAGVAQTLQARRTGDIVWAPIIAIEPVPATPLVYDFVVPGRENFWAGGGLLAHNTHGPRMRPKDGRAIPAFASQALTGQPITVAGDGSQTRSIIYVDDLIEGIMRLLRSDLEGPVNIGNPHEVSILYLAETIKRLTNSSSDIVFIDRPVDDPSIRQPDITLAKRELGWEPQIGFEEGLKRTLAWFAEHPELIG
jgi:nucleoside-diphosphate-sugar epimerase/intein/homing endonuclease